jgi:hypothetical protein
MNYIHLFLSLFVYSNQSKNVHLFLEFSYLFYQVLSYFNIIGVLLANTYYLREQELVVLSVYRYRLCLSYLFNNVLLLVILKRKLDYFRIELLTILTISSVIKDTRQGYIIQNPVICAGRLVCTHLVSLLVEGKCILL